MKIWIPATTSVALSLLLMSACGPDANREHEDPDPHPGMAMEPDPPLHEEGTVTIPAGFAAGLGVTLAEVRREDLRRTVRTTGEIVPDETRLSTVSLRYGGWAERLHADFTGRAVRAGEPLLEVYSPELVSAQEDLLSARRLAASLAGSRVPGTSERADGAVAAARERLRFWQVPDEEIRRTEETGEVQATLLVPAATTGHIVERNIQAGERFEAGQPLYRMADLSRVWLEAEVYERDLPFVQPGARVDVEVAGRPHDVRSGRVDFVQPVVDRERRTARVRVVLPNPDGTLKPGMYATARLEVEVVRGALTVPRDAVMHTGERAVVFVARDGERFDVREVRTGAEAGGRIEILDGLEEGERVVARAGFLLDAESRLMEAMTGQPGMPGMEMDMPGMDMGMPPMEMDDRGGHDD